MGESATILLQSAVHALSELLAQAWSAWQALQADAAGRLLLLALACPVVLAVLAWRRTAAEADSSSSWRTVCMTFWSICLMGLAWTATWHELNPAQLVVAAVLAIMAGAHWLWLVMDGLTRACGWRTAQTLCKRIALNRAAYYLLAPTLVLLGLFVYVPAVSIVWTSLFSYDIGGEAVFVGFANYMNLATDPIFAKSMTVIAIFAAVQIAVTLVAPFIAAEAIFHLRHERSRYYIRVLFVVPMVVPGVIVYLIWQYLYSDAGPIALLGHHVGLGDRLEGLISRPNTALAAVIFVGFPFVHGINLLIFYAGLSSISNAVWEAAELDGVSWLRRVFVIDIPLLLRQIRLLLILGLIGAVQAFENVLVMTQGGPGWETMLPGLYMYRSAMAFNEFGYACAIGVCLFAIVVGASLLVGRVFKEAH